MVVVPRESKLNGDIALAVALIAAEFGVDARDAPEGVLAVLRSFSAAHYNAGVRDTMVRLANHRSFTENEPVPSASSVTPIVGPHGRRMRAVRDSTVPIRESDRATPIVPAPMGAIKDDD